jgi:hypothetical protein
VEAWNYQITKYATTRHVETNKIKIPKQNFYKGKYKPVIPEQISRNNRAN